MNQVVIFSGIALFIIIILLVVTKPKKKIAQSNSIFDKYSEHGKIWVKKMWDMYKAGSTWDKLPNLICEVYEKNFGITLPENKYKSYWRDIGIPDNYLDADESSLAFKIGDFHFLLGLYLDIRYQYQYKPLTGKNNVEVMKEFGLNIESDEILYYSLTNVDWYEEQTISTNISYMGFRYRTGGRMNFNTGTFNVARNNIKGFVLLDRGNLYITNRRIIFISGGSVQNRSINLSEILEFIFYKDGILLGKANGKKPLISFPVALNTLIQPDDLNQVIRILDRVLSCNETEDLTPENFKTV
jgi:hypothetical protein